jgi:hypothetical protein
MLSSFEHGIGAEGLVLRLRGQDAEAAVVRALDAGDGEVWIGGPAEARLRSRTATHAQARECVRAFVRDGGASAAVAWVE